MTVPLLKLIDLHAYEQFSAWHSCRMGDYPSMQQLFKAKTMGYQPSY